MEMSHKKGVTVHGTNFSDVLEGCISDIIGFTTPAGACRLSLVSKTFLSASESDVIWERFLPAHYDLFINLSDGGDAAFPEVQSKKELYMLLADRPLLFDGGTKSFWLDKASGRKCWMIASRGLAIGSSDSPACWYWRSIPESRFPEIIQLLRRQWIEIRGVIYTSVLSPETIYDAYLVFKMTNSAYGFYDGLRASVVIPGCKTETQRILHFHAVPFEDFIAQRFPLHLGLRGRRGFVHGAKLRTDGWQEVKIGEFFTHLGQEDHEVYFILQRKTDNWKSGLIVEGIEIRPATLVQ